MLDLIVVLVTIVTFVAFIGFTEACELLLERKEGTYEHTARVHPGGHRHAGCAHLSHSRAAHA